VHTSNVISYEKEKLAFTIIYLYFFNKEDHNIPGEN